MYFLHYYLTFNIFNNVYILNSIGRYLYMYISNLKFYNIIYIYMTSNFPLKHSSVEPIIDIILLLSPQDLKKYNEVLGNPPPED